VRSVAFSQDSRRLISGSYDGLILVWDAHDGGTALRALAGHVRYVMTVRHLHNVLDLGTSEDIGSA